MLTFTSKPARIFCRVLAIVVANGCIPFGFAVLIKDPFAKPAPAPLDTRTHAKPSRVMSSKEQKTQQGRIGECPYLAGQAKWDPTYKGVDMLTGNYSLSVTDLSFEGGYGIPVNITRSYSANMYDEGAFGQGWTMSADVRSTAGGLLKGPAAPVQSVPTAFKERPPTESNPVAELADGAAAQPAQAVTVTDSGGTAETVQRDVDGVLTTPPWDNNTNYPTYELVSFGGSIYQCLTGNQTTTMDGTVYTYVKEGNYPSGNTPYNNPSATATPANVLKVTTAVDRQGNTTTYGYGSGTISLVKDDGTTSEHPLTSVTMPNGHVITLTWGNGSSTPANRVVSVSDGCGRTVTYGYTPTSGAAGYTGGGGSLNGGQLTSVTTPGEKTTSYAYGGAYQPSGWSYYGLDAAYSLLTGITDPRGMTTSISYQMDIKTVMPYNVQVSAPVVYRVAAPNGINTDYEFDNQPAPTGPSSDLELGSGTPGTQAGFYEYPASQISDSAVCFNMEIFLGITGIVTGEFSVLYMPRNFAIVDGTTYGLETRKDYSIQTEDLMTDREVNQGFAYGCYPLVNLDTARGLPESTWTYQMVTTADVYNFGGNKLSETVTEQEMDSGTLNTIRTAETDCAYWDATKYYQQKAVKDQAGRYSMTDYYANSASAGSRGQTYKVYDNAHAGFYLDTSITPPSWASSSDYWKYQLTPTSGDYSAECNYDSKGRCVDAYKLKGTSGFTYVQTHTTYGSDTDGSWGGASTVVEDYGGIGRTTTNNAYTSDGEADDVTDADGHEFVTSFDGDGVVQSVTRTDTGPTTLVSYTYGTSGITNGMPTAVTDGLSGVSQSVSYDTTATDPGYGQVASVTETNGSDSYTDSYTYGVTGDRATATYATPSATARWKYGNYVPVGDPSKGTRAFQTLTLLDSSSNPTSEEMHYSYDEQGRLQNAAFAQSPASGYTPSSGATYYPTGGSNLASARARAFYSYDPAGRILSVYHWWDAYGSGSYSSTAILGNSCSYEYTGSKRGLKTASTYWTNSSGSFTDAWDESYGYETSHDCLASFSTTDGQANASQSWSYDAAGNRISDFTGTSWAYDNLNRMTSNGAGTSFTNDVLGNRTATGSSISYSWDCLNEMTGFANSSVTESYVYRADGMRVSKSNSSASTKYRYDGQMGMEDVDTSGSSTTATEYGLGARGVDYMAVSSGGSTAVSFPVYDAHGNMVAMLSRSGSSYSVAHQRDFDPWGNIRNGASTGDPKDRYCANVGHKQDDETGLIYMRARYYDSGTGRFASEDGRRSGLNWYVYACSIPTDCVDGNGQLPSWLNAVRAGFGGAFAIFGLCFLAAALSALAFGADVDMIKTAYNCEIGACVCFTFAAMCADTGLSWSGAFWEGMRDLALHLVLDLMKDCQMEAAEAGNAAGMKSIAWVDVAAMITYSLSMVAIITESMIDDATEE